MKGAIYFLYFFCAFIIASAAVEAKRFTWYETAAISLAWPIGVALHMRAELIEVMKEATPEGAVEDGGL